MATPQEIAEAVATAVTNTIANQPQPAQQPPPPSAQDIATAVATAVTNAMAAQPQQQQQQQGQAATFTYAIAPAQTIAGPLEGSPSTKRPPSHSTERRMTHSPERTLRSTNYSTGLEIEQENRVGSKAITLMHS